MHQKTVFMHSHCAIHQTRRLIFVLQFVQEVRRLELKFLMLLGYSFSVKVLDPKSLLLA